MRNNKVLELLYLLIAVIATRAIDIIGTYHYTPDLGSELNPAVSMLGAGWTYILVVQLVAIATLNYVSLFVVSPALITQPGLTFKEFVSIIYFERVIPINWSSIFMHNPKGKHQILHMYGWIIPRIVIYVGIVLAIVHFLLAFVNGYAQLHKFFVVPMYVLMLSSLPVCIYAYLKHRYNDYLNIHRIV